MSTHIDIESLEALAAEQTVANSALIAAHVESCDECRDELAWLRAERALFSQRAEAQGDVDHLWRGVEEKLAHGSKQRAPYRDNALPLPKATKPLASRWWLLAAALPLVLGMTATFAVVKRARSTRTARSVVAQRVVHGATLLRVRVASADLQIERGEGEQLRVVSADSDAVAALVAIDERTYELRFERTPTERVRVEVPRATALDVTTSSGDVTIGAIGGATKILTSSGDIVASEVGELDVTSTSGDVRVRSATGSIAIRTSSGDIDVERSTGANRVLATSTSGAVRWAGRCANECAMQVRSNSGDVHLGFDRVSSAMVHFDTSSGSFRDGIGTQTLGEEPSTIIRRIGAGAGAVNVETTSGSLSLELAP